MAKKSNIQHRHPVLITEFVAVPNNLSLSTGYNSVLPSSGEDGARSCRDGKGEFLEYTAHKNSLEHRPNVSFIPQLP